MLSERGNVDDPPAVVIVTGSRLYQLLSAKHLEICEKRTPLKRCGVSRRVATLLKRMSARDARTATWLTEHAVETDPTCLHCDKPEEILHALVHCPVHATARRQPLPELFGSLATTVDSVAL